MFIFLKRSCRSAALVAYLGGRLRAAAEKTNGSNALNKVPNNTALAKPTVEKAEACGACASHRATIKTLGGQTLAACIDQDLCQG